MSNFIQRSQFILKIAWPLIIANSFWNLQLTIDRVFLGMYSTEALGAAMAVMGVFWVPMALLQQTAGYVTSFIAQYTGAGEHEKIGGCLWQSFYVSVIGGILFLGFNFLSKDFFAFVGHSESMQKYEVEYFNTLAYCALPTALTAAISGFFTGIGKTKTVIGINLVGLILNIILDYVMIFGKWGFTEMGVAGAGYATALASYGSAVWGLFILFNTENETIYKIKSQWQLKLALIKQFLKFGIPSGLQWAFEGLAFTTFLILIGHFKNGEAALSSSSIAVTIMMLSVLPSMGIAQAVLTLVGQKLGEKNPDEAERITWDGIKITFIYILFVAASFWFVPQFYLSWFKNEENMNLWTQVSTIVPVLLQIVSVFTIFDSFYLNISFALKGAGDTRFVSLVALTMPWPLMVLPAYLLKAHDNALIYSWLFVAFYIFLTAVLLTWRFKQGRWKTMSLIH